MSAPTRAQKQVRGARRAFFGTRSRVSGALARVGEIRVTPAWRGLRWLSAAALVLFGVQVVTGILLALYYYPEPGGAYASTRFLTGEVPVGWLVRGVHRWASEMLLVAVSAHLVVAYARRAYAKPREYVWVVGVLLLGSVLAFRFTGSLLPFDAGAHAAARRGLELLRAVPLVGSLPAAWLSGGEDVGANTLSRFFATHALILPWFTVTLLAVHLALVRRHGLKGGGR
jgi:quinol-cytochrome oxidoreductase complex cytochrome b subunit